MTASDLIWVMAGIGIGLVVSMAALSVLVALERRRLRRPLARRPSPAAVPVEVEQPAAPAPPLPDLPPHAEAAGAPADDPEPPSSEPAQLVAPEDEAPAVEDIQALPPPPENAGAAPAEPEPPDEKAEPLSVEGLFAEAFRVAPTNDTPQPEVAPAEWRPAKPRSQQSKNEDADELPKP